MVVTIILLILAAVAMPVTKFTIKRNKEAELRLRLRVMRNAIDEFKRYSDAELLPIEFGTEGYPSELDLLVEGVDVVGEVNRKKRFLRRIPIDPMTGEYEWPSWPVRCVPGSINTTKSCSQPSTPTPMTTACWEIRWSVKVNASHRSSTTS